MLYIQESAKHHIYDMIIVGGGPGGYTAALYAGRSGLSTLVFEKLSAGGQMASSGRIDNYPGFENGIDGFTLGEKMKIGAERFGAKTKSAEVVSLELAPPIKTVKTASGECFYAKTVILATGAVPRELGIAREKEFIGKGISYCAACDGMLYQGKTVAIVGGGNSAAEDALILCRVCKEVILIHRRDTLRADKVYADALMKERNISFLWDSVPTALLGEERLCALTVQNLKTKETHTVNCDGAFVSIGRVPDTALIRGQVALNDSGYIIADESTRTSIAGVFAVGDVRAKAVRQIVTAVADGAVAVHYALEYLSAGGKNL